MSATTINGAIEHFVKGAACELPRGIRINVVSPTVLEESMGKYADFFPGFVPVPAARVAQAYKKSVLGYRPVRSSGSMAERSGQPNENGPRHGARFVICVASASPATGKRLFACGKSGRPQSIRPYCSRSTSMISCFGLALRTSG